ncbi:MAG: chorismate synthase [Pseudomonadota bacterium]|jgi:chorismate synthase
MPANSFGSRFVVTTFGESHGPALGVVIDGCPAGVNFDADFLAHELARRRPGGALVSGRQERDQPEVLSGIYEGKTLGTPIAIVVRNHDARSEDYAQIAGALGGPSVRGGHADDVWRLKFGHSDPRGGGRSSGRETVSRVMAGAVAQMVLRARVPSLHIRSFAEQIGPEVLSAEQIQAAHQLSSAEIDGFPARFPSVSSAHAVSALLEAAKRDGKSYGGRALITAIGVPVGLGQPVFHKLKADLAAAFLGIGATCAVEIGEGEESSGAEGSEFHTGSRGQYGGIRGGISTGERLEARVSFKPTSSVLDVAKKGRHDPCIVPRAIPVLEAMMALVLVDHWLWMKTDRGDEP